MAAVAHGTAIFITAAGLVVAVVVLAKTRKFPLSLALLLDYFTAASLLRLVGSPSWPMIGTAALTIVIRQLASRSLAAHGSGNVSAGHRWLRAPTIRGVLRRR
jgi:hypothetical protein